MWSSVWEMMRSIIATALSPYVRVFDGPHTVDGEPLATLEDYLRLVQQRADLGTGAAGSNGVEAGCTVTQTNGGATGNFTGISAGN